MRIDSRDSRVRSLDESLETFLNRLILFKRIDSRIVRSGKSRVVAYKNQWESYLIDWKKCSSVSEEQKEKCLFGCSCCKRWVGLTEREWGKTERKNLADWVTTEGIALIKTDRLRERNERGLWWWWQCIKAATLNRAVVFESSLIYSRNGSIGVTHYAVML